MASQEANLPFIRNLASSERKTRTQALTSLQTYLTTRRPPNNPLTDLDALKLWTGLFYSMWMCDRPLPQQALAADLADILLSLHPDCATPWLRAFWSTMAAKWTSIDVLRMEKFLLLVRRVFAAALRWMRQTKFDDAAVRDVLALLEEWPFDPEGDMTKVPLGLRLHVLDLWVDELERANYLREDDAQAQDVARRIGDLVQRQTSKFPSKQVRKRAADSYEDERLPWVKKAAEVVTEEEGNFDDTWEGIED